MANNITINEGTAKAVKTREIASEQVQAVYLNIGTALDNPFNGTITEVTRLAGGSIAVTAGTVNAGTINAATVTSGSIVVTAATVTSGSIVVTAGTVTTTLGDLQGGTIDEITGGSIVVTAGTITNSGTTTGVGVVTTLSNLTNGTVRVTAGSVGGLGASGAATVGNPVLMGGTDSGGTLYAPLITTTGAVGSVQNIGTIKEAGTVTGVGVVTTVTNLSNGTIQNSGTTTGVGTVSGMGVLTTLSNLTNGTVRVTAGSVGGLGASGAATVGNPVLMGGTDGGGTLYAPLITTTGAVGSVQNIGTIKEAGTVTGVGVVTTVTTVSNVTNGTIRVTAGTVNSGTINTGTINAATINAGTLSLVTTVSNLTNGTIRVTAGTVNAGTINTGTINAATINAGTVRDDGRASRDILTFGTTFGGTGTAAAYATLVAAPGASNYVFVNDLTLTNPYGTVEAAIGFGTAVDGGSVLVKGVYGTQTGIGVEKVYPKAVNGGIANQPLVVYKSGLGTIYANVTYFTSAA